ncbi:MAG: ABC transporter permease, partial [Acidimicrobiia bacterium]
MTENLSTAERTSQLAPPNAEQATPILAPRPEARMSSAGRPGPGRLRRLFGQIPNGAYTALLLGILLVLAQLSASNEWISPHLVPAPTDVWSAFTDGVERGLYWRHAQSTLSAMLGGFLVSSTLALLVAAVLVSSPRLEGIIAPLIVGFEAVPKVAVAPLVLLWVGFGQSAKVTIVVMATFFPILVSALQGLRVRDRDTYEVMRVLGASRLELLRYLQFPGALPSIFAGLKIGIVFALLGAVVAELVGAYNGLGYLLMLER